MLCGVVATAIHSYVLVFMLLTLKLALRLWVAVLFRLVFFFSVFVLTSVTACNNSKTTITTTTIQKNMFITLVFGFLFANKQIVVELLDYWANAYLFLKIVSFNILPWVCFVFLFFFLSLLFLSLLYSVALLCCYLFYYIKRGL